MAAPVFAALNRAAGHVRHNTATQSMARVGLAARGVLYLLLTYLTGSLLVERPRDAQPANAQGAMDAVTSSPPGVLALALAAVGFAAFAVIRMATAWHDREGGLGFRLTTLGQGLMYVLIAYVPIAFLLGSGRSGSEQQQHQTAGKLLRLHGGQTIVFGLGLVFLAICAWQVRTALRSDYSQGLELPDRPPLLHRVLRLIGLLGIIARAVVFLPIGAFLILAAVTNNAARAQGLDAELTDFSGRWWGIPLLVLASCSFFVFALYSFLEARYRNLHDCR